MGKSLETIFWVKIPILKFFDADPGAGIRDEKKNSDPGWNKLGYGIWDEPGPNLSYSDGVDIALDADPA